MDYTLFETKYYKGQKGSDLYFRLNGKNLVVWKRPFASQVLRMLSKKHNLHISTASEEEYAMPIVRGLFGDIPFKKKLFEQKDAKPLAEFGPCAVLIDDLLSNHVDGELYLIKPFDCEKFDIEMLYLLSKF